VEWLWLGVAVWGRRDRLESGQTVTAGFVTCLVGLALPFKVRSLNGVRNSASLSPRTAVGICRHFRLPDRAAARGESVYNPAFSLSRFEADTCPEICVFLLGSLQGCIQGANRGRAYRPPPLQLRFGNYWHRSDPADPIHQTPVRIGQFPLTVEELLQLNLDLRQV
jgi:hypothetical protein